MFRMSSMKAFLVEIQKFFLQMAIWVKWKGQSYLWRVYLGQDGGFGLRDFGVSGCLSIGVYYDVCIAVQEFDEFFQILEVVFEVVYDVAGYRVLGFWG